MFMRPLVRILNYLFPALFKSKPTQADETTSANLYQGLSEEQMPLVSG
jgi:hypothetical protein